VLFLVQGVALTAFAFHSIPEPEGMVCFFTYALAPELGLLLDKLKPEIAQRLPHKIIAPIDSPRFSRLHPRANQSTGQLNLYLRWRH
jgi:hypothetical protein